MWKNPDHLTTKMFMSRTVLDETSAVMSNPFEIMASMFDMHPMISMEAKDVSIEIPYLYQEDLTRYIFHVESWLHRNGDIAQEWAKLATLDPEYVEISTDIDATINTVRRNLEILHEYRMFPHKLYSLVHVYDTYVEEVYGFVNQLESGITGWMQVNANRFSQYVDTIILLVGIIETRQILIDFSVNRSTKCAKCRQDNYDYYSCKLSLLCVDLPVLRIPPFKLPNIYMDLSNIALGIDVVLPKFNFVPRKVPLLSLPDLPAPTDIEANITLPEIPVLPRPPQLPELLDVQIDFEMELPVLPPAPRVPELMPVIRTVVKVADLLGTIFCTFK